MLSYLCSDTPSITRKQFLRFIIPCPQWVMIKWPSQICLMVSFCCLYWVYCFLIIAMFSPWYYVQDNSNKLYTTFGWQDVSQTLPNNKLQFNSYSELGLTNVYVLTNLVFLFMILGYVSWFYFGFCWCGCLLNRLINCYTFPQIFFTSAFTIGMYSTVFVWVAWIAYCFYPVAYTNDTARCDDRCTNFAGSNATFTYGPYVGWSFALIAAPFMCCTVILFKLAYGYDSVGRSWINKYKDSDSEDETAEELLPGDEDSDLVLRESMGLME